MSYAVRITRDTAKRIINLTTAAAELLDGNEREAGEPESTLKLVGYGETLIARWDPNGEAVVDLVRDA